MMIHRIDNAVEIIGIGIRCLDGVMEEGGFISEESLSELRLQQAEDALRAIADTVKNRREALRRNEPILHHMHIGEPGETSGTYAAIAAE